jgi:hypothetical protein
VLCTPKQAVTTNIIITVTSYVIITVTPYLFYSPTHRIITKQHKIKERVIAYLLPLQATQDSGCKIGQNEKNVKLLGKEVRYLTEKMQYWLKNNHEKRCEIGHKTSKILEQELQEL